jgi:signal transduction histidine kinase
MDSLVHDVRNPLNALVINVEILRRSWPAAAGGEVPPAQAKNLHAMREQVARVNATLGEFARFLAPSPTAPAVHSLSAMVQDAVAVLGHAGAGAG